MNYFERMDDIIDHGYPLNMTKIYINNISSKICK